MGCRYGCMGGFIALLFAMVWFQMYDNNVVFKAVGSAVEVT